MNKIEIVDKLYLEKVATPWVLRPSPYTEAFNILRYPDSLLLPVGELDTVFTLLYMVHLPYASTELAGTANFVMINMDGGGNIANWFEGGASDFHFENFPSAGGNTGTYGAKTWDDGDCVVMGIGCDLVTGKFFHVWDGTIQAIEEYTVTPGAFLWAELCCSDSNGFGGEVMQTRVYKGKFLTQTEVTSEANKMKSEHGL